MASIQMEAIRTMTAEMTQSAGAGFFGQIDPAHMREIVEINQANMPIPDGVTFTDCMLDGMYAELSTPNDGREDAVILYCHGGGLICGTAKTARGYASVLAKESRIPVYSFSYGLAPEHTFPEPVDDCFKAYKRVMEMHPDVPLYLIGESAGAYLSLATALKVRDEGLRRPAGIILNSVVIDFSGTLDRSWSGWAEDTVTDDSIKGQLADFYCPDKSLRTHPYCSPLFADFKDLPPMLVVWDKGEALAPDSEEVIRKATEARVPVEADRFEETFHACAPVLRNAPETSKMLDDTIAFIYKHLHDQKLDWEE